MRALAWYARMVPVLLPLAQVMFKYSEHPLDSFLQYKLTNISKYSYTTKLTNISKYWWTWFSDWPHRFHLPHCGNRHRTLCHCMPPVFQGLTFWLLVSFVLIIVSLPVFVRICLYLSATPFSMYDLAVGDFFCCWLLYKVGRRSLAKIFTTMAKKCWCFLCIVKFQRFLSLRSSISVRVCFLKIKASVRIELQLWAINYMIYFINGEKMSSSVGMPDQTMDSLPNLIKN